MQVTFSTTKHERIGGYRTGRMVNVAIDPAEICAVSSFKDRYAEGKSVHLKSGHTFGTTERLSEILQRVAETAGMDAAKGIQVIVHDRTPGRWGHPHTRVRTTGDHFSSLNI